MLLQAVYSAKFFVSSYTSPNSAFNIDVQVNIFLFLWSNTIYLGSMVQTSRPRVLFGSNIRSDQIGIASRLS